MLFYHNYKPRVTCRGEGPIKIRFRRLSDNIKYLICDGGNGNIYHYDNFFEWKDGRRGERGCEKLTGIGPRIVGRHYKNCKIRWFCDFRGELGPILSNPPDDWDNAVWILPNNNVEGPFLFSKLMDKKQKQD